MVAVSGSVVIESTKAKPQTSYETHSLRLQLDHATALLESGRWMQIAGSDRLSHVISMTLQLSMFM